MPDLIFKRHEALIRDERIIVAATSEQLFENAQKYRSKNLLLSTNGVDIEHWKNKSVEPPNDLKSALTGRIVVGYHGALAKWIDFDLLYMIADHGDYELVLIGYEHDQEFEKSGLKKHPRVHFLGNKSYFDLNLYVSYYDIAILPFKKTKFTDGVSPIKIFEYMAASKPIVATDLRECRKYQSCLIAKTKEEFILQLSTAINLRNNPDYHSTLDGESKESTWYIKAIDVLDMAGIIKAKTSLSPR
jgi:glycosyltransferase involved in cell wall biosynthesis